VTSSVALLPVPVSNLNSGSFVRDVPHPNENNIAVIDSAGPEVLLVKQLANCRLGPNELK